MKLDAYLSSGAMTAAELARRSGMSGASITRILNGEQKPSFGAIKAIVEATEGNVTADDLVFGLPETREERAA